MAAAGPGVLTGGGFAGLVAEVYTLPQIRGKAAAKTHLTYGNIYVGRL